MIQQTQSRRALRSRIIEPIEAFLESNEITKDHLHELLVEHWHRIGKRGVTRSSFNGWFQGARSDKNLDNWRQPPLDRLIDIYEISLSYPVQLDALSIFTGYDTQEQDRQIHELRERLLQVQQQKKDLSNRLVLVNHYLSKGNIEAAMNAAQGKKAVRSD